MRKFVLITALSLLTATSAMAAVSKSDCSVSNINQIAMNQGLSKATALSKECIAKGYTASKSWLMEKGSKGADFAKDKGSDGWDFAKEKGAAVKDAASNMADKGLEKAADLKKKLFN